MGIYTLLLVDYRLGGTDRTLTFLVDLVLLFTSRQSCQTPQRERGLGLGLD